MNETTTTSTTTTGPDEVWGVNRPPALPPTTTGTHGMGPAAGTGPAPGTRHAGPGAGPTHLDRGFSTLTRSPLRRDTAHGVLGGVAAGIAARVGVSPAAVRVAAVVLAMFFGAGVGAYLIAWAVLPDESGRTHAEQAVRGGRPRSLAVVSLGAIALLGALSWVFSSWPLLLATAVVAYVVAKKSGHFSPHSHG